MHTLFLHTLAPELGAQAQLHGAALDLGAVRIVVGLPLQAHLRVSDGSFPCLVSLERGGAYAQRAPPA